MLRATGWEAEIAAAYASIPSEYKGYVVIAKRSKHSYGDNVIPHPASLHLGVKDDEKEHHAQTGHKVLARDRHNNGHNLPRDCLYSKYNKQGAKVTAEDLEKQDPAVIVTAQDLFEEFVLKHQKPAVSSLPTKNVG